MCLLVIYTCLNMLAKSECGQDQYKVLIFRTRLVYLVLSLSTSTPLTLSFNPSLSSLVGQLSEPVIMGAIPGLNLSLQQVKERAHQKRSNKRAPPMDWSKKNELFSNL